MIVENSFKIMLAKSGFIWKILLYQFISAILIGGICLASCYQLFAHLFDCGIFSKTEGFVSQNVFNFNFSSVFVSFAQILKELFEVITSSTNLLILAILFVVLFYVLFSISRAMLEITVCECVYGHMGSSVKLNFFGCFISNLWKGIKFGFCKMATSGLFGLLIVFGILFGISNFGKTQILDVILPFVLILGLVLMVSIKQSLFCMWVPNMVTNNEKIWKSFGQNFKIIARNFKTVFGITAVAIIVSVAINLGLCVLTCGVGLLLSVPAGILFFSVLYNVMFFHFCGLKYYVDKDKIITPKKLEDIEKIGNMEKII